MLVTLLFELLVGGPQYPGGGQALGHLADELPVEVVVGLGQGRALGRDYLGLLV